MQERLKRSSLFAQPVVTRAVRFLVPGACVLLGGGIALYSESPLLTLLLLATLALAAFSMLEVALYVLLASLPFSFRTIFRMQQTEFQMPTEPLLGILAMAYGLGLVSQWIFQRFLAHRATSRASVWTRFPLTRPLVFYLVSLVVSVVASPQFYVSMKGVIRTFAYLMLAFVVHALVRSERQLKGIFAAAFPSAAIAVIWTVAVLIQRIRFLRWTSAYQGTPFTNYSVYGAFTGVFLLILLARLLFDRKPYDRVMWTTLLLIFTSGMFLCFSRGAWLSVLIAVAFLFFHRAEGTEAKKAIALLIAAFVSILILSIPSVLGLILERVQTVLDTGFASNKVRLLRWAAAIRMFLQHPITGTGYGTFGLLYQSNVALVGENAQYQMGAHSEYFQALAETGLLGFVSWIYLIVAFFRYAFRHLPTVTDPTYRALLLGLIAAELSLCVHLLVVSILDADRVGVLFWGIFGLMPAIARLSQQRDAAEEIHHG